MVTGKEDGVTTSSTVVGLLLLLLFKVNTFENNFA